jgi:hypothetical protein
MFSGWPVATGHPPRNLAHAHPPHSWQGSLAAATSTTFTTQCYEGQGDQDMAMATVLDDNACNFHSSSSMHRCLGAVTSVTI